MTQLTRYSVGPLATNCYLLELDAAQNLLIDPGDDGDFLSEQIIARKLSLTHILLTHGHFDHVLGLLPLHLNFPKAQIYLHPADHFLYQQAVKSAKHWVGQGYSPNPPPPISSLLPLTAMRDAPYTMPRIISTPGHTPGSVCFYLPHDKLLFSGDTLFKQAVGRTDLSYSSPTALTNSLKLLAKLPPETLVYPGHDEPTTIGQEFEK